MTSLRSSLRVLPVLAIALAGLAACGEDSSSAGDPAATAPTTASTATGSGTDEITVTAEDFSFDKTAITAPAGKVTINLVNMGKAEHEFVLLKTDADPASLPVGSDDRVDESASVGEISETQGGASGTHIFDLKPGKYVFVCNIPGHYKDGMAGELTVS